MRCVSAYFLTMGTEAKSLAIAESKIRVVTGRTGHLSVARETLIEKDPTAELDRCHVAYRPNSYSMHRTKFWEHDRRLRFIQTLHVPSHYRAHKCGVQRMVTVF